MAALIARNWRIMEVIQAAATLLLAIPWAAISENAFAKMGGVLIVLGNAQAVELIQTALEKRKHTSIMATKPYTILLFQITTRLLEQQEDAKQATSIRRIWLLTRFLDALVRKQLSTIWVEVLVLPARLLLARPVRQTVRIARQQAASGLGLMNASIARAMQILWEQLLFQDAIASPNIIGTSIQLNASVISHLVLLELHLLAWTARH